MIPDQFHTNRTDLMVTGAHGHSEAWQFLLDSQASNPLCYNDLTNLLLRA